MVALIFVVGCLVSKDAEQVEVADDAWRDWLLAQ
jgi:hypothetical protein